MKKIRPYTRLDKKPNTSCGYCDAKFFRYPVEIRRYKVMFCSKACQGKWNKENLYNKPNTICAYCNKFFHKRPSRKKVGYKLYFCNKICQGQYWSENFAGDKASNWQGGKTALRVNEIQHTAYRTWRKKLLIGAKCILCHSEHALELHHIEYRKDNPSRVRDESNVCPMCEECHDLFHSNSSKGEELRGRLNAILAHGNPQPSQSEDWKVQRLTDEDKKSNKSDTSIAAERHDIV